jgi:hypothetical protein
MSNAKQKANAWNLALVWAKSYEGYDEDDAKQMELAVELIEAEYKKAVKAARLAELESSVKFYYPAASRGSVRLMAQSLYKSEQEKENK